MENQGTRIQNHLKTQHLTQTIAKIISNLMVQITFRICNFENHGQLILHTVTCNAIHSENYDEMFLYLEVTKLMIPSKVKWMGLAAD